MRFEQQETRAVKGIGGDQSRIGIIFSCTCWKHEYDRKGRFGRFQA